MTATDLPGLRALIQTVAELRHPERGCPWDREQNHDTLKPYALEEVHEFLEALSAHGPDSPETWEELGDVLFQVVLHAQLLSERNKIDLDGLASGVARKLVERHPHVFDPNGPRFKTSAEVNKAWEQLKAARKAAQPAAAPISRAERVASVPRSLPALQRAARVGEKAAAFRFDWPNAEAVLAKVDEEVAEFKQASTETHAQEEFGDLLFALAQYARLRRWDPEAILTAATNKFLGRFRALETEVERQGRNWDQLSLDDLEATWQKIKKPL